MFGVLINVGSSSLNPNGRGQIFDDGTFEYLPIPEEAETVEKVPTYLGLGYCDVKFPNLPVHVDPEFETFTYGHVKRGFGDISSILKLSKDDVLFFYASLRNRGSWAPFIIGYFKALEIHDCRHLSIEEIASFKSKGFSNNAHLKRVEPHVDFLIKGGLGSKLLKQAFPLSTDGKPLEMLDCIREMLLTPSGEQIKSTAPWFRWTLISNKAEVLLENL